MKQQTHYTKELLEPIIQNSINLGQVLDKLDLTRTGYNYNRLRKLSNQYGLDRSHFKRCRQPTKYTKELLEPLIKESSYWAEVMRKLNLRPSSGMQDIIKGWAIHWGIDSSHFRGTAWNKGTKNPYIGLTGVPDEELFKERVNYRSSKLYLRLLRVGIEDKCIICNNGPEWNNKPLRLQVDHINGDRYDNRLENLRLLCPNCHTQTPTWGSRSRQESMAV